MRQDRNTQVRDLVPMGESLERVRYNGLVAMLGRNGTPVSLGRQTGPGYAQA